jgi:hypothetical protein
VSSSYAEVGYELKKGMSWLGGAFGKVTLTPYMVGLRCVISQQLPRSCVWKRDINGTTGRGHGVFLDIWHRIAGPKVNEERFLSENSPVVFGRNSILTSKTQGQGRLMNCNDVRHDSKRVCLCENSMR